MFLHFIYEDIKYYTNSPMQIISVLTFFLSACISFVFAVGTTDTIIKASSGGVWVIAIMSISVATSQIFNSDKTDGTLDMWVSFYENLYTLALARILTICIIFGLPLWIITPVVASAFGLDNNYIMILFYSLVLTTPGLFAIHIFASSLTLHLRSGTVLSAIIGLPLSMPLLIFGASAVNIYQATGELTNTQFESVLIISGGLSVLAIILCPLGISIAIRHSVCV